VEQPSSSNDDVKKLLVHIKTAEIDRSQHVMCIFGKSVYRASNMKVLAGIYSPLTGVS